MKTSIYTFITFLAVLALFSCEDRDDKLTRPNLRIQNLSGQNLKTVTVRTDSLFFENITSKSFSDYLEFEVAYERDTLRVEADSTIIEFVPDTTYNPLPIGLYTYQLDIDDEGKLVYSFKID